MGEKEGHFCILHLFLVTSCTKFCYKKVSVGQQAFLMMVVWIAVSTRETKLIKDISAIL